MSVTGRRKDAIWNYFIELEPDDNHKIRRAQCKQCDEPVSALVARMRTHWEKCNKSANALPIYSYRLITLFWSTICYQLPRNLSDEYYVMKTLKLLLWQ